MQPIIRKSAKEARARYDAACREAIRLYVPGSPSTSWNVATRLATELYAKWRASLASEHTAVKRKA